MRRIASLAFLLGFAHLSAAQDWRPMGPPGGDVRTLTGDPSDSKRLYLGTADGHVFASTDAGEHWRLLGRVGTRLDAVITAILVDPRDPRILYASAWTQDSAAGGVFRSEDAGRTWRASGLSGQAVRALAQAPSNPDVLVAGTLEGVYRSRDAGSSWDRISPEGHEEIRQLDSVAIDPRNPEVIYIGTFHLPWKTTDSGRRWFPIHTGMIDDSDVMSILVDRANPRRIFASACSGIYRSENGGALWKKIQGIPFSARRTHVIRQDARRPSTVYAATTEGLWKTTTGGAAWQRVTPRDWVITSIVLPVGSSDRIVIGTERLGVLVSDDGGQHFRAANVGFYHRQIVALTLDRERPGRVLAVLSNAPEPVLATKDGGRTWTALGPGLKTEGLRRLFAAPDTWWATLERGGLMRYDPAKSAWFPAGMTVGEAAAYGHLRNDRGKRKAIQLGPSLPPQEQESILRHKVNDLAFSRSSWFAATDHGLLSSTDSGRTWKLSPVGPLIDLPVSSVRVSGDGRHIWLVSLRGLVFSHDSGKTWSWHDLPLEAGGALRLDVASDLDADGRATMVASARKGLYLSRDSGRTWHQAASGLPSAPVQDVALVGDTFLASMQTGGLFISYDRGRTWARIEGTLAEGQFPVVTTSESSSIIFAASATEGLYAVEFRSPTSAASANGRAQ
ncbi:MAG: hypothetical protein L0387_36605 [Acidobacteria bacterium]|nr:hypothetical protein [Acidobacteriota bacterium]